MEKIRGDSRVTPERLAAIKEQLAKSGLVIDENRTADGRIADGHKAAQALAQALAQTLADAAPVPRLPRAEDA